MHFWEDFSFGRRRVLERLVLSRKKAQEVKKFEIKSTLQLKSSILSLGMISRRTALKSPLVQGGTIDQEGIGILVGEVPLVLRGTIEQEGR